MDASPPPPEVPGSPRLLVVGPIARDTSVLVDRLPGAGEAAQARDFHTSVGGKGGTAALVAARLGAEVGLLGAVGVDEEGDLALAELRAAGVDVEAVERQVGETTGHVLTWIGPDAARHHVEWQGANALADPSRGRIADALAGAAAVLISAASPRPSVEAAVACGREASVRVVLDIAGNPETVRAVLGDVDIVRGDAAEAGDLVGSPVDGFGSAATAVRRLLDAGPGLAIVQAGDDGDLVASAEGEELRLPHLDIDVVDPTGAGDALIATLSVLLCEDRPLGDAARLASAAAAHAASHLGARPTFAGEAELVRLLAEHPPR